MLVRAATAADAEACAAIYATYVLESAITFEVDPPSVDVMVQRIVDASRTHGWLVAEVAERIVGYAYATQFKPRPAYRWTCEVTVYVESGRRRTGTGAALYDALFAHLSNRGYFMAAAAITVPNVASEGLHRSFGFDVVGTFPHVGYKNGGWHDVLWMQRSLGFISERPTEPN
jgi:L-amino acid N-acyltransferase YncA